jgi:hypothetical protein
VWRTELTAIVINPKRQRGGGSKAAAKEVRRLAPARATDCSLGASLGSPALCRPARPLGCQHGNDCGPAATPLSQARSCCPLSLSSTQAAPAPKRDVLSNWSIPGNAGRAFGALTGDRNPIHLFAFTAQLFGFKRPIAHALFLVSRLEAALANEGAWVPLMGRSCARAGGPPAMLHAGTRRPPACALRRRPDRDGPIQPCGALLLPRPTPLHAPGIMPTYPATFETEFKRPTMLPAKLQCTAARGTSPLDCAVLTADGSKDVILGKITAK